MSLRLPKIQNLGNAWDRIWDSLFSVNSHAIQGRKPRSLKIDPLEERQLLSISADATTLLVSSTSSQYTLGAQSVATDDNGDVVVCWTGYDSVWDADKHTYVNDANIYAKYLTQNVQQVSLAKDTTSFSLIYGSAQTSDGKLAIVQKLTFNATTASLDNVDSTIAGSIKLNFGSQSVTQSYYETDYENFASDLQINLRALGGQFTYATVVADDARTFSITYAAKTDVTTGLIVTSSGSVLTQNYLAVDSLYTTFTSGYLPGATMSTTSTPLVIGTIKVDPTNPANTIASIESYLEGKTASIHTYVAPTGDGYTDILPATDANVVSLGLDVTVTYTKDSSGLYRYNIEFNGDAGKVAIPQLQIFSRSTGTVVSGSSVGTITTIKQSSEVFRVNATEIDNGYTYGLDLYDQKNAAVAMDGDGDFVITWESENADGTYDIHARRFEAQSYIADTNNVWSVDMYDANGNAYTSAIQCVRPVAAPITTGLTLLANDPYTFVVNTITANDQGQASIGINSSGTFVISWCSTGQYSSFFNSVYYRAFTADGKPVSTDKIAAVEDANEHANSNVAISHDGNIGVVWTSYYPTLQNGYIATNTTIDGIVVTSTTTITLSGIGSAAEDASIAFDMADDFVIAWCQRPDNDSISTGGAANTVSAAENGVYARLYNASGTIIQDTFRANSASLNASSTTSWAGYQGNPQVVIDADGDITISYEGYGVDVSDTTSLGALPAAYIAAAIASNPDLEAYLSDTALAAAAQYSGGDIDGVIDSVLFSAQSTMQWAVVGTLAGKLEYTTYPVIGTVPSGIEDTISATDTEDIVIMVKSSTVMKDGTTLYLGSEKITLDGDPDDITSEVSLFYTVPAGYSLYNCKITRGVGGTKAAEHDQGTIVKAQATTVVGGLTGIWSIGTTTSATDKLLLIEVSQYSDLAVNDTITIGGETMTVTSIADYTANATNQGYTVGTGNVVYLLSVTRGASPTTHAQGDTVTGGSLWGSGKLVGSLRTNTTTSTIDAAITSLYINATSTITAGQTIYIDGEAMLVNSISNCTDAYKNAGFTVSTGHYYYMISVTRGYDSTTAATHARNADVSAQLTTAQIENMLGRLSAILNNYFGLLRGEANGVMFSQFDAQPTYGVTNAIMTDTVVNQYRDGNTERSLIVLDSDITSGNFVLRIHDPYNADIYQDITVTPVIDYVGLDANGDPLWQINIDDTIDAINAAMETAVAELGVSWPANVSDGPIRVRQITSDEINLRAGTDWELTGIDSATQVVFEVTYQGEVHDLQVTVELAPAGNHLLESPIAEEQTITFTAPTATANGGLYYALSMGGTTSADLIFDVTAYNAGTLDMSAQIRAALEAIAAQNAALAGLDPAPVVIVDVEVVDGTNGLQYTVKFHGLCIGVDQASIAAGTTAATYTAPDGTPPDSTIYADHGGVISSVEVVKGAWPKANDPLTPVETYASTGTAQYDVSVAIQSDGTLVFAWSQYDKYTTSSAYGYYGKSIFVRTFEESTDTAGAVVTGIESSDGTEVIANGTMTVASITDGIAKIVLDFNEALYCVPDVETQLNILGVTKLDTKVGSTVTINGATVTLSKANAQQIAQAEAQWEKSALNPAAYQILSNGIALNGVIVNAQYGLNAAVDAGVTTVGSNKYQVVLTFDYNQAVAGNQALPVGNYTIKVKHYIASTDSASGQVGLCDAAGNSLNLTGYTAGGADFTQNFTIATSSGAGSPTTPAEGTTDTPTNTTQTGKQDSAVVASAADGSYVVVWVRYGANGDATTQGNIIAQRYDSSGKAVGNEFIVNSFTAGDQISPTVSMNDNGSFVVVWSGVGTGGYAGIWARAYSSKGVAATDQIQISQISTANQVTPSVAMDANGGFVVTWIKSADAQTHVYARYYNSYGVAVTNEFKVDTSNFANSSVDVAISAATGKFVIVWQSCSTKGTDWDIHARVYNASSNVAATSEITVNSYVSNAQTDPAVAMDYAGNFVVTWTSYGQDGSGYGVYARRYNAAGAALAGEFLVNKTTASTQWQSDVACDDTNPAASLTAGSFTIVWSSYAQDNALANDYGVYARMYLANGTDYIDAATNKAVGQFRVNATVIGNQVSPSITRNATNSDYVVTWVGPDTDSTGIFSRRLDPPAQSATTITSTVNISTIGLYDAKTATVFLKSVNSAGNADLVFTYGAKANKWTVISGDWDGDGVSTLGLYDPSTSTFYLADYNSSGSTVSRVFKFGTAKCGYAPIVGDWDGDGIDTIGLYNTKTATFYLRNSNTTGAANLIFKFGSANAGYMAVIGDWDGNGTDTVGVYNGKTSTFYLRNANSAGGANMTFKFGTAKAGSIALAGDWDGDGKDSIGLYTAKTGTFTLRNANSAGSANYNFRFGSKNSTWKPIIGDWNGYGSALTATEVKTASSTTKSVTASAVQTLVSEAISRWVAAGISSAQAALLSNVKFVVTDLAGANLGLADGNVIYIDANAAGNGWYVDSTPSSDSEFTSGKKVKGIDLLTVLEHEMGHILGLSDIDSLANDVMSRTLTAGTRRNASNEDVIDLILASR